MTATVVRLRESSLDLADVGPFQLGHATIDPARRRVCWGQGERQELEPRVMKVLVVLAQAEGQVVSRDRLIQLCWDDRIVGDDAVNRCIQSLRRLAGAIKPTPFTIETTARVGYALIEESRPATDQSEKSAGRHAVGLLGAGGFRTRAISLALGAALIAGAIGLVAQRGVPGAITVSVAGDSGGAANDALARALIVDLNELAGANLSSLALVGRDANPDLLVTVSTRQDGGSAEGNLTLTSRRARELLWSATATGPANHAATLRGQLSAKLATVLNCAAQAETSPARLSAQAKRLFLTACEQMEDLPDQNDINRLKKLTALAPSFAPGWSRLALGETDLADFQSVTHKVKSPEEDILHRDARSHLTRAQALDPELGTNFVTLANLTPAGEWGARLRVLQDGVARDPDEYLLRIAQSGVLADVGYTQESIAAAQRAVELMPLSMDARTNYVAVLAHGGLIKKAQAELAAARQLWPASQDLRLVEFSVELRYGDARKAQRLIDAGDASLGGFEGERLFMKARLDPTPENVAKAVQFFVVTTRRQAFAAPMRLQALGQLGVVDAAYDVLKHPRSIAHLREASDILFRPHLVEFRRDPRFPEIAKQLGLLQFWQSRGQWPDFCLDPLLRYDCKAEAKRLLG